jgi:hypothetical protein
MHGDTRPLVYPANVRSHFRPMSPMGRVLPTKWRRWATGHYQVADIRNVPYGGSFVTAVCSLLGGQAARGSGPARYPVARAAADQRIAAISGASVAHCRALRTGRAGVVVSPLARKLLREAAPVGRHDAPGSALLSPYYGPRNIIHP